jgi:hypothetical protein
MAKKNVPEKGTKKDIPLTVEEPRSLALAQRGIRTGADFANMMSALMSDIIAQRVTPQIANATVNAGGKLLKVVEMQYKYGGKGDQVLGLTLAPGEPAGTESVN